MNEEEFGRGDVAHCETVGTASLGLLLWTGAPCSDGAVAVRSWPLFLQRRDGRQRMDGSRPSRACAVGSAA